MRNIIQKAWFSGKDTVGAVLIQTDTGKYKAYIGIAMGLDEEIDAQYIAERGAKLPITIAEAIFPDATGEIIKD